VNTIPATRQAETMTEKPGSSKVRSLLQLKGSRHYDTGRERGAANQAEVPVSKNCEMDACTLPCIGKDRRKKKTLQLKHNHYESARGGDCDTYTQSLRTSDSFLGFLPVLI
jgi:hypothetical protein